MKRWNWVFGEKEEEEEKRARAQAVSTKGRGGEKPQDKESRVNSAIMIISYVVGAD